jgi:hypothetical protein
VGRGCGGYRRDILVGAIEAYSSVEMSRGSGVENFMVQRTGSPVRVASSNKWRSERGAVYHKPGALDPDSENLSPSPLGFSGKIENSLIRTRTTALIYSAAILEKADETILPAIYLVRVNAAPLPPGRRLCRFNYPRPSLRFAFNHANLQKISALTSNLLALIPLPLQFVGRSLGVSPSQLGYITFSRALVQAIMSPVSGILGDRYDRAYVIAAGCCEAC